ncbi:hypothetical protein KDK_36790 [Dictyobacter kobayashii]|uniref:Uncharacterized protein n=1 Tax=Dictyobacter kobayashii TaxID=2014872 RepID=A0A402ALF6_9CHLR|nr:hypothetical protein KDK_36790 [Dictyobacter kobayashii]
MGFSSTVGLSITNEILVCQESCFETMGASCPFLAAIHETAKLFLAYASKLSIAHFFLTLYDGFVGSFL